MFRLFSHLEKAPFYSHRSILWRSRVSYAKGCIYLLLVNVLGLSFPLIVKAVVDRLEGNAQAFWVPRFIDSLPTFWFVSFFALLFLACIAIITLGRYYWRVYFVFVGLPRTHEVRQKFFKKLFALDTGYLHSRRVGDFISVLSEDSDKIRMTLSFGALAICDTILNLILFSAILFYLDFQMAAFVLPFLILSGLLLVVLSDRLSIYYERVQDLIGNLTGFAFEIASGVRVIKAFGREKDFHANFVAESRRLEKASVQVARYQSLFVPLLYFCLGLATCFVMIYGGHRVISGQLALSSFIAFQLYLVQLDWPMVAMGWFVELFRGSRASEKRMSKVAQQKSSRQMSLDSKAVTQDEEFELSNVSYSFDGKKQAISQLSLSVPRQKWIGLTGPVGCGKSTLLELLCRELEPHKGEILWRGQNLKSIEPSDLSRHILYVPQEIYLFSKSLRNNLLFGSDGKLGDEALLGLLDELSFDLEGLAGRGGLWTRLGERGTNFSGGQKQRLAIARAILRRRAVYLFDDIFSHLDAETELKIFQSLRKRISPDATVFFVSQRLETLEMQDLVLILNRGETEFFGSMAEARQKSSFIQGLQELQREQMLVGEKWA